MSRGGQGAGSLGEYQACRRGMGGRRSEERVRFGILNLWEPGEMVQGRGANTMLSILRLKEGLREEP